MFGSSCMGCEFRTIDDMDSRMGLAKFVTRGKVLQDEKPGPTSS